MVAKLLRDLAADGVAGEEPALWRFVGESWIGGGSISSAPAAFDFRPVSVRAHAAGLNTVRVVHLRQDYSSQYGRLESWLVDRGGPRNHVFNESFIYPNPSRGRLTAWRHPTTPTTTYVMNVVALLDFITSTRRRVDVWQITNLGVSRLAQSTEVNDAPVDGRGDGVAIPTSAVNGSALILTPCVGGLFIHRFIPNTVTLLANRNDLFGTSSVATHIQAFHESGDDWILLMRDSAGLGRMYRFNATSLAIDEIALASLQWTQWARFTAWQMSDGTLRAMVYNRGGQNDHTMRYYDLSNLAWNAWNNWTDLGQVHPRAGESSFLDRDIESIYYDDDRVEIIVSAGFGSLTPFRSFYWIDDSYLLPGEGQAVHDPHNFRGVEPDPNGKPLPRATARPGTFAHRSEWVDRHPRMIAAAASGDVKVLAAGLQGPARVFLSGSTYTYSPGALNLFSAPVEDRASLVNAPDLGVRAYGGSHVSGWDYEGSYSAKLEDTEIPFPSAGEVRYEIAQAGGGEAVDVVVALHDRGTLVAEWEHPAPAAGSYVQTLTPAQLANIDSSDGLRVEMRYQRRQVPKMLVLDHLGHVHGFEGWEDFLARRRWTKRHLGTSSARMAQNGSTLIMVGANWGASWNAVIRSTDGGLTWHDISANVDIPGGAEILGIHQRNGVWAIHGAMRRIWWSNDNGATWTLRQTPVGDVVDGHPWQHAAARSNGMWAIAGPGKVLFTNDMGASHTVRTLPGTDAGVTALAYSDAGTLLIGGWDSTGRRLWRTTNDGGSFVESGAALPVNSAAGIRAILHDGTTWWLTTAMNSYGAADVHGLLSSSTASPDGGSFTAVPGMNGHATWLALAPNGQLLVGWHLEANVLSGARIRRLDGTFEVIKERDNFHHDRASVVFP